MKQKNMILMVVAVGCGLVAAFLTSQMSGKSAVEQVEVIVAAKDLSVGTQMTKDDLKTLVKRKKMPKDGLPPMYVIDENELLEKRLSRPVRADELFNPGDLSKGGVVTLPPDHDMYTLPLGVHAAVAGFVGPGSKVDVIVTVRLGNTLKVLPLLVDMLVLAVDTNVAYDKNGTFPSLGSVSFAVKRQQAMVIELAKARGCTVALVLRHPEKKPAADEKYSIDEVVKLLSDEGNINQVKDRGGEGPKKEEDLTPKAEAKVEPKELAPPVDKGPVLVKVPAAKEDIAAGTDITKDLIAEKFELIEVTAKQAETAHKDLTPLLGKVFRNGLGKGQTVTASLVGVPVAKSEQFNVEPEPKPGPLEPKVEQPKEVAKEPKVEQPKVEVKKPPVKKNKTIDTTITTASGPKTYRYEEVKPNDWRLLGEVSPNGEARTPDKVD